MNRKKISAKERVRRNKQRDRARGVVFTVDGYGNPVKLIPTSNGYAVKGIPK